MSNDRADSKLLNSASKIMPDDMQEAIAEGANVNVAREDSSNNTPLHRVASGYSEDGAMKQFSEAALDTLLSHPEINLNPQDKNGHTPAHAAAIGSSSAAIGKLKSAGADLTIKNNNNETAPDMLLKMAFNRGDMENVDFALDLGATGAGGPPKDSSTFLHKVATGASQDNDVNSFDMNVLKKLTATKKIDLDAVDGNGNTASHIAAKAGNKEVMQILVDAGANLDVKNGADKTPSDIFKRVTGDELSDSIKLPEIKNKPSLAALAAGLGKGMG